MAKEEQQIEEARPRKEHGEAEVGPAAPPDERQAWLDQYARTNTHLSRKKPHKSKLEVSKNGKILGFEDLENSIEAFELEEFKIPKMWLESF